MAGMTKYVGLDLHKESITVAVADGGERGEARHIGRIENTPEAIRKLVARLAVKGAVLRFCYEAGPCGYGALRLLARLGHDCIVVAPTMTPRRLGDKVKTDRRDAMMLARLHRAGELTPVWVPDREHEAMRDLVRARTVAVRNVRRARQQVRAFLLRHGIGDPKGKTWSRGYHRWLLTLAFEHPAQQIALQELIDAVGEAERRRDRIQVQIEALLPSWSLAPVVRALQGLRGFALVVAVTLVSEVGDMTRFASPRQLMAFLGLTPSETSSGGAVRRGKITKTGNGELRRTLIEASWTYRMPARISGRKNAVLEKLPPSVREIAWKAQTRLCARYRRMVARGKPSNVVVCAIAREVLGFAWAIAREVREVRPAVA